MFCTARPLCFSSFFFLAASICWRSMFLFLRSLALSALKLISPLCSSIVGCFVCCFPRFRVGTLSIWFLSREAAGFPVTKCNPHTRSLSRILFVSVPPRLIAEIQRLLLSLSRELFVLFSLIQYNLGYYMKAFFPLLEVHPTTIQWTIFNKNTVHHFICLHLRGTVMTDSNRCQVWCHVGESQNSLRRS